MQYKLKILKRKILLRDLEIKNFYFKYQGNDVIMQLHSNDEVNIKFTINKI